MARKPRHCDAGNDVVNVTATSEDMAYWDAKRQEVREGTILALANYHERLQAKARAIHKAPRAGW